MASILRARPRAELSVRWDEFRQRSFSEHLCTTLPTLLAIGVGLWWLITMYGLVKLRHDHFGSFDYDLGMYDQGIWLLARGSGFMTVRGMHVFGHHANIGYLLLVPFYWLGAGPNFLDFVNTLGVVACVVPLFLMVRDGLRSRWAALGVCLAFLFHYVPGWMVQETFHVENVAAPFILGALWAAWAGKWRWYWPMVAFALIWKEDVALVIVVVGLIVACTTRQWRRGLLTTVVGALWFVFCVKVFIPFFSPDGAVFDNLFGSLGKNATEVAVNAISEPSMTVRILQAHGAEPAAVDLLRPYLMTSFVAPHMLLMGLPQFIVNLLSIQSFTWETKFHYMMFPYLGVLMGSVRAALTRSRRWVGLGIVALMVLGTFLARDQGIGPWSTQYDTGYWPLRVDPALQAAREAAVAAVGPNEVVTAPYNFVPHLSHRREIYTFPNPWVPNNYGARPGIRRDPARVDVLIMQPSILNKTDAELFGEITGGGQFELAGSWGAGADVVQLWRRHRTG
jgi:uncharacterized membrane protein